jgi:hypothetical protein
VVKKIASMSIAVLLTTVLVVKLARVLFDVQLAWLYFVVPVSFVVGAVVVARQQRRT